MKIAFVVKLWDAKRKNEQNCVLKVHPVRPLHFIKACNRGSNSAIPAHWQVCSHSVFFYARNVVMWCEAFACSAQRAFTPMRGMHTHEAVLVQPTVRTQYFPITVLATRRRTSLPTLIVPGCCSKLSMKVKHAILGEVRRRGKKSGTLKKYEIAPSTPLTI